jgi:isoquinoline 1-oxidoreductase
MDTSEAWALEDVVVAQVDDTVCVAAPDRAGAQRARAAVRAAWSVTEGPAEDELAGYLRSHPEQVEGWGGELDEVAGDPERALAGAGVMLADTYTTAYLAHAPLETRCAVAAWEDERLTVWVGTQRPFATRATLAERLGLDERQVRVVVPTTGGGYGGKHSPETALCAARLAIESGRPVKLRWSRDEEFSWAYFRPAAVMDLAAGLDADGRLIAWHHTNLNAGAASIHCPYDVPNQHLRFQPAASPLPQGAYRALAATANTFARERHIDRLARAARHDPVQFRHDHLADARTRAVLEAVAVRSGDRLPPGHARGVAVGVEKGGHVATSAEVARDGDGLRIVRIVTAFECGAIVDPRKLRAQVEGATVMGLGGALFEAVRFDRGRVLNASFAAYRVPRFSDVPSIEVELIDRPDLEPAGGGETPIIAVAPAIANAAAAAGCEELRDLPFKGAASPH